MKNFLSKVSLAQWAGLIIAVLAIIFVLTNRDDISISLFGWQLTGSAWSILLGVLIVGWLVGVLTSRSSNKRKAAKAAGH